MLNRKYVLVSVLLIFFGISSLEAASGVNLNIRFFDRRVYFLDQEPIYVLVTITNYSPAPFRFRLADERAFSLDFDTRTAANREVEPASILLRRRSQSQHVFFREVTLETGESFSFVENLREYAALTHSGAFVVQARFFPELLHVADRQFLTFGSVSGTELRVLPGQRPEARPMAASTQPLVSNRLTLNLRHRPVLGPDGIPLQLDVETHAILVRERLPPDEVVRFLITARQRGQWERFFLYLDLEAMLSRDAHRRRQWNAESEEGRQRMLARYREDLQSAVVDGYITLIPTHFEIERTVHTEHEGTVTVMKFFRVGNFTERKRYTWFLERRDDIWMIVDFSVVNLGTQ